MSVGIIKKTGDELQYERYATKSKKSLSTNSLFGFEVREGHLILSYNKQKPEILLTENKHLIINV